MVSQCLVPSIIKKVIPYLLVCNPKKFKKDKKKKKKKKQGKILIRISQLTAKILTNCLSVFDHFVGFSQRSKTLFEMIIQIWHHSFHHKTLKCFNDFQNWSFSVLSLKWIQTMEIKYVNRTYANRKTFFIIYNILRYLNDFWNLFLDEVYLKYE